MLIRAPSKAVTALICCALLLSVPTHSRAAADIDARLDALFGAHQPYEKFLDALKASVAAKDWRAVAATVAYPIKIKIAGHRIRIRTAEEFAGRADAILTAKVVAAVQRQAYASLFADSSGVMVGDGELWFSGVCEDTRCVSPAIRITAINP